MSKERPRYKVLREMEGQFKKNFAKELGKGLLEVTKAIKKLSK